MTENETEETPFEAPEPEHEETHVHEDDGEPVEPTEPPQEPEPGGASSEPEPAPDPAEPQGASPEQWDARFKKADQAFARYEKSIRGIFEDDADALVVIAISPGAPPGFVNMNDAGRVPDDFQAPVMEFFGISREQDYADDPYTDTCDTCKGKGNTRTGSSVPGKEKRVCPTCNGAGFTIEGVEIENGHRVAAEANLSDASPLDDFVQGDRDNWGEPKILPDGRPNPNHGKFPQFKELVEPWGVTANLGAQDAAPVEG